jgi:hypothetical protein
MVLKESKKQTPLPCTAIQRKFETELFDDFLTFCCLQGKVWVLFSATKRGLLFD